MTNKRQKKAILYLKICGAILVLGLVLLFAFRNSILDNVIQRIDAKLDRDYQCNFTIQKAEFQGLTNLEFHDISLVPHEKDTLVSIGELKTSVNFWKLLIGDIQLATSKN